MDFEHRKLVACEIALPYAREGATRAKAGGGSGAKGSGGKTNAHDNFAKGLFVQACPASCVRPAYVLRASCVRPACVCDENSHNSV